MYEGGKKKWSNYSQFCIFMAEIFFFFLTLASRHYLFRHLHVKPFMILIAMGKWRSQYQKKMGFQLWKILSLQSFLQIEEKNSNELPMFGWFSIQSSVLLSLYIFFYFV